MTYSRNYAACEECLHGMIGHLPPGTWGQGHNYCNLVNDEALSDWAAGKIRPSFEDNRWVWKTGKRLATDDNVTSE